MSEYDKTQKLRTLKESPFVTHTELVATSEQRPVHALRHRQLHSVPQQERS